MHVSKIRVNKKIMEEMKWDLFMKELNRRLENAGFKYSIDRKARRQSFNFGRVRLSKEHIRKHGYNISPSTGRRGNILGWNDWVRFNNTVNNVMDKHSISANVSSLGGKFKIRKGTNAMTEADWESLAGENVGSMMQPVARRDAWHSEKDHYEVWDDEKE